MRKTQGLYFLILFLLWPVRWARANQLLSVEKSGEVFSFGSLLLMPTPHSLLALDSHEGILSLVRGGFWLQVQSSQPESKPTDKGNLSTFVHTKPIRMIKLGHGYRVMLDSKTRESLGLVFVATSEESHLLILQGVAELFLEEENRLTVPLQAGYELRYQKSKMQWSLPQTIHPLPDWSLHGVSQKSQALVRVYFELLRQQSELNRSLASEEKAILQQAWDRQEEKIQRKLAEEAKQKEEDEKYRVWFRKRFESPLEWESFLKGQPDF
jgi:hypothetical protein